MKPSILACLVLMLAGCATQEGAVRCEGRLEPINMPASKPMLENSSTPSTTSRSIGEGKS